MNILILNGGPANGLGTTSRKIRDAAAKEFQARGWNITAYDLDTLSIKPCRGCFACWLKHPGACAIQDDEEGFIKSWVASDAVLMITPVTFGGYSSALKMALDRSIPVLLPFFVKSHGEIHHPQRYRQRRRILAAGTLPGPDAEAERSFHGLVRRNALNMASLRTESQIFFDSADDAEVAARVGELAGAAEAGS